MTNVESNGEIPDSLSRQHTLFVQSLEKWLDAVINERGIDSNAILKHVRESYNSNLTANMQYHNEIQKAEMIAGNHANAAYHNLMCMLYESLIMAPDSTHDIVAENNRLLKGNRQMMKEISELVSKVKPT